MFDFRWKKARAIAPALLLLAAGTANGSVIYCGIGNDDFANDVNVALAKINPCLNRPGDSGSVAFEQNGDGIIDKLQNARMHCQPGDIYIFHYAGHGDRHANNGPGPEGDMMQGAISTLAGFGNNEATDDDVAAEINAFPECCAVLTILDCCFAGEFIDEPTDINNGAFIGTASNCREAPGNSIFLPLWCQAFMPTENGGIAGDLNGDGCMTLGELYDLLATITTMGHDSDPVAANFYDPDDPHLEYCVWEVPAPSTLSLLGLGGLMAVRRRRS